MENQVQNIRKDQLIAMGFQLKYAQVAAKLAQSTEQAIELISKFQVDQQYFKQTIKSFQSKPQQSKQQKYSMSLLVMMDLKMGVGKIGAQCGHAALGAFKKMKSDSELKILKRWEIVGQKIVVLRVSNQEQGLQLQRKAQEMGINTYCVRDAGHTQVKPNTLTVIAIGPQKFQTVKQVTGHLKLL